MSIDSQKKIKLETQFWQQATAAGFSYFVALKQK